MGSYIFLYYNITIKHIWLEQTFSRIFLPEWKLCPVLCKYRYFRASSFAASSILFVSHYSNTTSSKARQQPIFLVFWKPPAHQYLGLVLVIAFFLLLANTSHALQGQRRNIIWARILRKFCIWPLLGLLMFTTGHDLGILWYLNYILLPKIDTKYHESPLMGVLSSGNVKINVIMRSWL